MNEGSGSGSEPEINDLNSNLEKIQPKNFESFQYNLKYKVLRILQMIKNFHLNNRYVEEFKFKRQNFASPLFDEKFAI